MRDPRKPGRSKSVSKMEAHRSNAVIECLREIAITGVGEASYPFIALKTGVPKEKVGDIIRVLVADKRLKVETRKSRLRTYSAPDGSWSVNYNPAGGIKRANNRAQARGDAATRNKAAHHASRLRHAPTASSADMEAQIAAFIATRGVTVCPPAFAAPVNNGSGL